MSLGEAPHWVREEEGEPEASSSPHSSPSPCVWLCARSPTPIASGPAEGESDVAPLMTLSPLGLSDPQFLGQASSMAEIRPLPPSSGAVGH